MADDKVNNPFRVLGQPAPASAAPADLTHASEQAVREELEKGVLFAKAETMIHWAVNQSRANSIWPLGFGLACCAIEMMATIAPRFDISRFGAEVMRSSPRQADLMIVAGRVSIKTFVAHWLRHLTLMPDDSKPRRNKNQPPGLPAMPGGIGRKSR